jgi:hypothetical protein
MPASKKEVVKKEDNYLVIKADLNYSNKLILPYDLGMQLMNALAKAEIYSTPYNEKSVIRDIGSEDISISLLGAQEYAEIKLNDLLTP